MVRVLGCQFQNLSHVPHKIRGCRSGLKSLAHGAVVPPTTGRKHHALVCPAARLLCEQVARLGVREGALVGRELSATQAAALKTMHPNKYNQKRFYLERFIDILVEAGVAERSKDKQAARQKRFSVPPRAPPKRSLSRKRFKPKQPRPYKSILHPIFPRPCSDIQCPAEFNSNIDLPTTLIHHNANNFFLFLIT